MSSVFRNRAALQLSLLEKEVAPAQPGNQLLQYIYFPKNFSSTEKKQCLQCDVRLRPPITAHAALALVSFLWRPTLTDRVFVVDGRQFSPT